MKCKRCLTNETEMLNGFHPDLNINMWRQICPKCDKDPKPAETKMTKDRDYGWLVSCSTEKGK